MLIFLPSDMLLIRCAALIAPIHADAIIFDAAYDSFFDGAAMLTPLR